MKDDEEYQQLKKEKKDIPENLQKYAIEQNTPTTDSEVVIVECGLIRDGGKLSGYVDQPPIPSSLPQAEKEEKIKAAK